MYVCMYIYCKMSKWCKWVEWVAWIRIYVYIYIHIYIYIYTYIHIYIIQSRASRQVPRHLCLGVCLCLWVCVHRYIHTYSHVSADTSHVTFPHLVALSHTNSTGAGGNVPGTKKKILKSQRPSNFTIKGHCIKTFKYFFCRANTWPSSPRQVFAWRRLGGSTRRCPLHFLRTREACTWHQAANPALPCSLLLPASNVCVCMCVCVCVCVCVFCVCSSAWVMCAASYYSCQYIYI